MAKVNSIYVDEVYSTVVVENLRPNSFLVEGVTYNPNYDKGDPKAGVVWYHKIEKNRKGSQAVGGDYTKEAPANKLIPIYVTNAFRRSTELRGVVVDEINAPFVDKVASNQAEDIREDKDACAIASLVYGGTASEDTAETTVENVIKNIVALKTSLTKKNARPNVLLISPDVESVLTQAHLTKAIYTPVTNDALIKAGAIGTYMGLTIFTRPELGASENSAIIYRNDQERTVDLSQCEMIMYDAKYFGKVDTFNEARIIPSERFAGMLANVEQNCGFGVTDTNAVAVKNKAMAA